ncbi:MAG TPA: hypothetical protein PKD11_14325, partial [Pyrinomonadaceae bacterium]|nr:hypothetical protein [Pyrinomonadaceae bacterium]
SAMFDTPLGITIWHDGRLLVADSGNRRVRVVEPDGRVWTLAGDGSSALRDGSPGNSSFLSPTAVAADADGAVYVADGNAIRAIGRRSLPFVETISGGRRGSRNGVPAASRFNRPSGIAVGPRGEIYVADSDNGLVREIGGTEKSSPETLALPEEPPRFTAEEFRELQPGRWPYDPPERTREIAGTLGEIRGEIINDDSEAWFHNGLDIPGGYGETARFIRNEKVLDPAAAENFGTSRELIRMPTIGYVHIRLGRDSGGKTFGDPRFQFYFENDKPAGVRVPRGTRFLAGEPIGTLNSMNHVHLIAGRPGAEMNALDALVLPGVSDGIPPVIENVRFYDESWTEIETKDGTGRIILRGKTRIVVAAYDRKDGNAERRRLAPYKIGYTLSRTGNIREGPEQWNISFEKMPPHDAVKYVYARGSRSGATGPTLFNFIATNYVDGERFGEGFIDPSALDAGEHLLRIFVKDLFGNVSTKDIEIEVFK